MEKIGKNELKKICMLSYKNKIFELAESGKSIREITKIINSHFIPRSKFKGVTLSKTKVHLILQSEIKKMTDDEFRHPPKSEILTKRREKNVRKD